MYMPPIVSKEKAVKKQAFRETTCLSSFCLMSIRSKIYLRESTAPIRMKMRLNVVNAFKALSIKICLTNKEVWNGWLTEEGENLLPPSTGSCILGCCEELFGGTGPIRIPMVLSVDDLPGVDPGFLVLDWLDPKVQWLVLDCESVLGLCMRGRGRRLGFRDWSKSWYWNRFWESGVRQIWGGGFQWPCNGRGNRETTREMTPHSWGMMAAMTIPPMEWMVTWTPIYKHVKTCCKRGEANKAWVIPHHVGDRWVVGGNGFWVDTIGVGLTMRISVNRLRWSTCIHVGMIFLPRGLLKYGWVWENWRVWGNRWKPGEVGWHVLWVVIVSEDATPHGTKVCKVREIAEEGDITRTKECCRPIILHTVQEYFWRAWQGQMRYV
jgi:hypothetical protein